MKGKMLPRNTNRPYRPSIEEERKSLLIPTLTDVFCIEHERLKRKRIGCSKIDLDNVTVIHTAK